MAIGATRGPVGSRLRRPRELAFILAGYLALGLGYSLATPVGEGPDEPGHVAYVAFLREHHRLPVHGEVGNPLAQQVKHPPLYYGLAMLASMPFALTDLPVVDNPQCCNLESTHSPAVMRHTKDELFPYAPLYRTLRWLRLLTLLLGTITIWATWQAARLVRPTQRSLAVLAASAVAFLPQHLFMAGVVNNDGLVIPLAALALLFSLRVVFHDARRIDLFALGIALGLGLLTKLSIAALVIVGAAAVVIAAWRGRSWRPLVNAALWTVIPLVVIAGGWLARNRLLYGDLLGWGQWEAAAATLLRQTPLIEQLPDYFAIQWSSFWGRFGWDTVPLPDAAYQALALATGAAIVGLGASVFRWGRGVEWSRIRRPVRHPRPSTTQRITADLLENRETMDKSLGMMVIVLTAVLVYASVFRLAFDFDLTVAQGRYLFGGLPAFAILLATGLLAWVPSWAEDRVARLGAAGLAALALAALGLVLWPAFRVPPRIDLAAARGVETSQALDFGEHISLLGYRLPPTVKAGTSFEVQLIWDTDRLLDEGYVLFLHLVDSRQEVPARLDALPLEGRYPTISWLPNWPFADNERLSVARWATPGPAKLVIGWYPDGRGDLPLPARKAATGEEVEPALGPILIER